LFLGFGPESFGPQFPHYQSVQLSSAYPDFYHESPHNIFLDALVSEGLSGLGILVGFSALAYFAARRAVSAGQRAAPYLASALAAGLTAGLFVSFTLTGALYFYGTVAMLAGLAANALNCAATSAKGAARTSERIRNRLAPHSVLRAFIKSHQDALSAGRPGASIPRRGRKKQSVALSLAAVALFLYFGIRLAASDFALGKATRDLNAGRIEESLKAYQWSQSWHPAGSSDDLYFSRALATASRTVPNPALALQASQQAFHAAQRAVQTSEERQNAWYNLAAFYSTQNNANGVEACLRRSVEASPNWFKPHWALAQVLLLSGRRAEAVAEADRAAELDGGKNSEVAKFLQSVHHLSALPGAE
jgi:tetratricopeptide (TPR) repeat protein